LISLINYKEREGKEMRLQIKDQFGNKIYPKTEVSRSGITFRVGKNFKKLRGMTFYGRIVGESIDMGSCPITGDVATIHWDRIFGGGKGE
jgi:hypothetical protein